jgi:hypothetical protein
MPRHPKEATMKQYVGLDVSMEETKIHVLDEEGGRVWRGKCRSEPGTIAATLHKRAPEAVRIGIDADSDDVGRAFRTDVGHLFRSKSAGRSD